MARAVVRITNVRKMDDNTVAVEASVIHRDANGDLQELSDTVNIGNIPDASTDEDIYEQLRTLAVNAVQSYLSETITTDDVVVL